VLTRDRSNVVYERTTATDRPVFFSASSWGEAMDEIDWEAGEVLVVGSSPVGHLARVFLGSGAIKIVRYSPVPVVVVPAAVASEVAEAAEADAEAGQAPESAASDAR